MAHILALLLAVATAVSAETCSMGWKEFNGNCYYFGELKYWIGARDDCWDRGAEMAIITDKATNDYVANLGKLEFHEGEYDKIFWLGLNDISGNGDFHWTDMSIPITYANWAPGEPRIGTGENYCGAINVDTTLWSDISCSADIYHYVCQQKRR